MNALTDYQIRTNAASRDRWEWFRAHRERVTGLLRQAPAGGRLGVLGAGNCNDLDLPALLGHFREAHLADVDASALADGVARQGAAGVRLHGGVDLTGMLEEMAAWSPSSAVSDRELADCLGRPLARVSPALPGPFDVAASVCLLSQLVGSLVCSIGDRHPRFVEAIRAVRAGHLRLLADLVAPGGVGLLVSDFVSSDTFAPLAVVAEAELPALAARLLREGNFFHGVNPAAVAATFRDDPVVASQVAGVEEIGPWRWDFGGRIYLVCAFRFRKAASGR